MLINKLVLLGLEHHGSRGVTFRRPFWLVAQFCPFLLPHPVSVKQNSDR